MQQSLYKWEGLTELAVLAFAAHTKAFLIFQTHRRQLKSPHAACVQGIHFGSVGNAAQGGPVAEDNLQVFTRAFRQAKPGENA